MKRIFIINPASGRIRVQKYEKLINKLMNKYKLGEEFYIFVTEKPNDIKRILDCNITNEESIVYVVGGDGTLSEALLGLLKHKSNFIPIPAGTGNDYVKSIYEYRSARKIILESFNDRYRKVDIMETSIGYALNVVDFGFDAQVAANIKYFRKIPLISGKFKYNLSILMTLFFNKNYKFKIRIDGKIKKGYYTLCAVGKGRFYGGGIEVLPKAKLSDKYLHVCLIRSTSVLEKLRFLPRLKEGKHEKINGVEMLKCTEFSIVSNKKFPISIDGEIYNSTNRFKVKVIPQILKVSKQTKKKK